MRKIFIDSSVLIELFKGNQLAYEKLYANGEADNLFFINPVVVSEITYILKKKLKFSYDQIFKILQGYEILPVDAMTVKKAFELMASYNLRPNDALILATVLLHNIQYFITLDSDFKNATAELNIELL